MKGFSFSDGKHIVLESFVYCSSVHYHCIRLILLFHFSSSPSSVTSFALLPLFVRIFCSSLFVSLYLPLPHLIFCLFLLFLVLFLYFFLLLCNSICTFFLLRLCFIVPFSLSYISSFYFLIFLPSSFISSVFLYNPIFFSSKTLLLLGIVSIL